MLIRHGGLGLADLSEYLTVEEAAEALSYHPDSVRRIIRAGKLQADKKGIIWLVTRKALQEYREQVADKAKHDPTRGV